MMAMHEACTSESCHALGHIIVLNYHQMFVGTCLCSLAIVYCSVALSLSAVQLVSNIVCRILPHSKTSHWLLLRED